MSSMDEQGEQQKLATLTGKRLGPYRGFNPVNRAQVWQWCTAMGDNNPLYLDDEYRKQTEFESLVAPPAMMQVWTMRDFNDNYAPGSTQSQPYQVFNEMSELGYTRNVAVSYDIQFSRYLTEGECPIHHTTIIEISDRKKTALGEGFFVTEKLDYSTELGKPFAQALISYFQYKPKIADRITSDRMRDKVATETVGTHSAPAANGQCDRTDLSASQVELDDALPELIIPITHKLIVGGAIATQDFIPVHHNAPAAQRAAMPDIFMNILTTSGLCSRYLSDWAGPASRLQRLTFKLMAPNTPGDCMTLRGVVKKVDRSKSRPVVAVDFSGANSKGSHVVGSADVELNP